mmetsp:Transcript_1836/g.6037  ORF Transcript_1836/g.6037 Transcript_1836/m.6037 type:complete len:260 (-) Transcript_1836:150-929(-)
MAPSSELDGLAGGGGGIVLPHLVPVDDVVEGGNVLRPAVLVLEVVGVLPHVDAQDGDVAAGVHQRVVLVGAGGDFDRAILGHDQPGPAGTKDSRGSGRELRLEAIIRSEGLVHLLGQVASRRAARLRSHRAPQEAVVVVAAARVVDLVLLGVGHQRDKRGGRLASHRLVQVSDVRLVVEVVVELHGGCIDVGLERIVCIRQRREREHGVLGQCRCGGPDCSHSRKAEAKRLAPVSPERVCRQTKLGKEDLLALVRGHTD